MSDCRHYFPEIPSSDRNRDARVDDVSRSNNNIRRLPRNPLNDCLLSLVPRWSAPFVATRNGRTCGDTRDVVRGPGGGRLIGPLAPFLLRDDGLTMIGMEVEDVSEPTNGREFADELRGTTCRCRMPKKAGNTFCSACYFTLPRAKQVRLYDRIGEGYEEAYRDAARFLDDHGRVRA